MPETLCGEIRRCVPTWTCADLDDPVCGASGLYHSAAFLDGVADRFFHVNVGAGPNGGDSNQRMPVIGGAHNDNLRLLPLKKLTIVFVFPGLIAAELFYFRCGRIQLVGVNVAHGNDSAFARLKSCPGDVHTPPAAADQGGAILAAAACP